MISKKLSQQIEIFDLHYLLFVKLKNKMHKISNSTEYMHLLIFYNIWESIQCLRGEISGSKHRKIIMGLGRCLAEQIIYLAYFLHKAGSFDVIIYFNFCLQKASLNSDFDVINKDFAQRIVEGFKKFGKSEVDFDDVLKTLKERHKFNTSSIFKSLKEQNLKESEKLEWVKNAYNGAGSYLHLNYLNCKFVKKSKNKRVFSFCSPQKINAQELCFINELLEQMASYCLKIPGMDSSYVIDRMMRKIKLLRAS